MPNHILQMTIGESENIKVEYLFDIIYYLYFLFDSSLLKTMYLIFILKLFQQIWFEAIFVQHQMDATIW